MLDRGNFKGLLLLETEIRGGRHPSTKQLADLLRRSEPQTLPPIVLNYIAAVLAGEVERKRGRPRTPWQDDQIEAHCLVRRVERWQRVYANRNVLNAQEKAFAKVAEEYGWANKDVAQRNYFREREKLIRIGNPDWWIKGVIIDYGLRGPRCWEILRSQRPRKDMTRENAVDSEKASGVVFCWGDVGKMPEPMLGTSANSPLTTANEYSSRIFWAMRPRTNNRFFARSI